MKKIFFFIFILKIISITTSKAEIAYIDINYILKVSEVGKFLNVHIEKKKIEHEEKFKKLENELVKKEKSLMAKQNILEKEEFENQIKILTKQVKEYRKEKRSLQVR